MSTQLPIPGFVDLQVNGYLGVDFSSPDLTIDSFSMACRALLHKGTAAFLPTLITSPVDVYARNLPLIASALALPEFRGRLLGIHLEGPFISPQQGAVGAHNPAWVQPPDLDLLLHLDAWADHSIRMVTLAAELEGAERLAAWAAGQGKLVSIGHTLGSPDDLERLSQAGAHSLTHLGNGLPKLLPKFANPLWAGLADDRYTAMLIGDGHHIPDGILRAMIRLKGLERTVIVSDAAPISGMPPGEYLTLGNPVILEESGRLYNPFTDGLVGSSATLLQCMNHLASLGFLSQKELLQVGFYNPLRLIGVQPEEIYASGSSLYYDDQQRTFSAQGSILNESPQGQAKLLIPRFKKPDS
jgi:N-acetylglucosamine-6-phosphate deacetylase